MKRQLVLKVCLLTSLLFTTAFTGTFALGLAPADSTQKTEVKKKWYETISIRGYMQVRYNRLLETNPQLKNEQGDRSIGDKGGVFIRRARLIFSANLNERIYFYIQPDIASSVSSSATQFVQMRDAYVDIGIDKISEFRVRLGQSKIPYGFETMQSSSNRLPFDRSDPINSAFANERDLGAFFYWAPKEIRGRFSSLVNDGYKGSGDYGVFAFGVFNGQTANKPEQNNSLHVVSRVSYPFNIGNQTFEPGIQAYTGKYVVAPDQRSPGIKGAKDFSYTDQRVAVSAILYPKPFGLSAEWNWGKGPEFNKLTDSIETQSLQGGYVLANYMLRFKKHIVSPYIRGMYYDGGKKHELDARSYTVREVETGIEWQPIKYLEFVAAYTFSDRRFEDYINQNNRQKGRFLRLQVQLNF